MAIDNEFGKGIGLAAGFDLGAQKPLDSRIAVNTIAERDAHVTENRAYEGMLVFVDATKLTYQLVNGEWKEFGFNANDFNDNIAEDREAIQANADAIEAINDEENGILAQAKEYADGLDEANKEAQAEVDRVQNEAIEALQEFVEGHSHDSLQAAIDKLNGADDVDGSVAKAVKAEADRAKGIEEGLQNAIDAINHAENGILVQAKAHAESKDAEMKKAIEDAQKLIDDAQDERIKALEDDKPVKEAAIKAAQDAADAAQADADAIEKRLDDEGGLVDRLEAAESFIANHNDEERDQNIADNKAAIDVLNGTAEEDGSVAKAVKDAVDAEAGLREDADNALDERLQAVEGQLANGGAIENRIAQAESDIDGLQGLVGVPADGENEASGLHLAVNNAQAKADQGVTDAAAEKLRAEDEEAKIRQELADEAAEIRGEMAEQHNAIDKAIADEAAAIRGEMEVEAARVDKKIADDIKVESDRALTAEGLLAGRLDVIEGEGEGSIKKAVNDLKAIHDEEMQDAEGRIAALEGLHDGENSIENQIANAKQEALNAVAGEKSRAEEQEGLIRDELADAIEKEVEDRNAAISAESALRVEAEGALQDAIDTEAEARLAKDNELNQAILNEKSRAEGKEGELLEALNKEIEDRGQAIEDAVAEINGAADALEARVKVNEDKLAVVQGEGEGSIAKALADAKAHAEQKIADLVDSAPDAMNTLNELAKAINDNKGIYDAWVVEHNQAMADLKVELQGEIDADVKVVADELANQKNAELDGSLANKIDKLQADVDQNEADCDTALAGEKTRAEAEEAAIRSELKSAIAKEVEDRNAAILVEQQRAEGQEAAIRQELADEKAALVAEDERIAGLVSAEQGRAEGKEAELLAAINKEVEDREAAINAEVERVDAKIAAESALRVAEEADIRADFAAADTALHAQVKSEMAAVIQSLAVGIVDGKLRVALGGIEGDDVLVIREQEIDFVTDADIEEIIAGLDAPAAE